MSVFHHKNPSHPTAVLGDEKLLIFNNSRVAFKFFGKFLKMLILTALKSAEFFKGFGIENTTRGLSKFGAAGVVMQSLGNAKCCCSEIQALTVKEI